MSEVQCWFCGRPFQLIDSAEIVDCPHCHHGRDLLKRNGVLFIFGENQIFHKNTRTPALGWTELTFLEALADSAKTCLSLGSVEKANDRLNKILTILRAIITKEKRKGIIFERCQFRETNRTRCNRFPCVGVISGVPLCKSHYKEVP